MQFQFFHCDLDGSLSQPLPLVTVLLWALAVAAAVVLAGKARPRKLNSAYVSLLVVLPLLAITPLSQYLLANVLFKATQSADGGITSIGFIPTLPVWPAALAAILAVCAVIARNRLHRPLPPNQRLQRTRPRWGSVSPLKVVKRLFPGLT